MPEIGASFTTSAAVLRFFRRKVNVPRARWDDLWHGQHAHGFMVAGAARVDLLAQLREAVDAAVARGETIEQFRARFAEIQARTGFLTDRTDGYLAWRTRVIYDTNLRTAQMAGRYAFMTDPDVLQQMPFWQYQHQTVDNPRLQHKAWDDLILRADDPWWRVHFPPNGWGCKCDVRPVSRRKLKQLRESGEPDTAPAGVGDVPPEWQYNVGEAAQSLAAFDSLSKKLLDLPQAWRERVIADVRRRMPEWLPDWVPFARALQAQLKAAQAARRAGAIAPPVITTNRGQPVGMLSAQVINAMQSRGVFVPGPGVLVTDQLLAHALRDQATKGRRVSQRRLAVSAALIDELPARFARPDAVFLDGDGKTLLVAMRVSKGRFAVAVVDVDQARRRVAGMRSVASNYVTTIKLWRAADFKAARATLLEGKL